MAANGIASPQLSQSKELALYLQLRDHNQCFTIGQQQNRTKRVLEERGYLSREEDGEAEKKLSVAAADDDNEEECQRLWHTSLKHTSNSRDYNQLLSVWCIFPGVRGRGGE